LVVPALEAARVTEMPGAFSIVPWNETDDAIGVIASLLGTTASRRHRRPDVGALLVELLERMPDLSVVRAVDVVGDLRLVKDEAEIDALAAASAQRWMASRLNCRPDASRSSVAPSRGVSRPVASDPRGWSRAGEFRDRRHGSERGKPSPPSGAVG
jgi:hypothetical protein